MHKTKVNLPGRSYQIISGSGILPSLGDYLRQLGPGDTAYIITNHRVKSLFGNAVSRVLKKSGYSVAFHLIPDSESGKSFLQAQAIIKGMASLGGSRRVFVVAFGGGVVGDVAGFAASVYKRGVPFIQLPTTLLAQVDSSIGGKNAVDLKEGKNLAGTFYQPLIVFSEVDFLFRLDKRQVRSGLAEVIKYALIADPVLFDFLCRVCPSVKDAGGSDVFEYIVRRCSKIKAAYVSRDEKDNRGLRVALNFGHTLGHALEAACGYRAFTHGEAVAWGMLCALDISRAAGVFKGGDDEAGRIESLIAGCGLPVRVKGVNRQALLRAYKYDKKFCGSRNRLVLLEDTGKSVVRENVPPGLINSVLDRRLS